MGDACRRALRRRDAIDDIRRAISAVLAQNYAGIVSTLASPHEEAPFLIPAIRVNGEMEAVFPDFIFRNHLPGRRA